MNGLDFKAYTREELDALSSKYSVQVSVLSKHISEFDQRSIDKKKSLEERLETVTDTIAQRLLLLKQLQDSLEKEQQEKDALSKQLEEISKNQDRNLQVLKKSVGEISKALEGVQAEIEAREKIKEKQNGVTDFLKDLSPSLRDELLELFDESTKLTEDDREEREEREEETAEKKPLQTPVLNLAPKRRNVEPEKPEKRKRLTVQQESEEEVYEIDDDSFDFTVESNLINYVGNSLWTRKKYAGRDIDTFDWDNMHPDESKRFTITELKMLGSVLKVSIDDAQVVDVLRKQFFEKAGKRVFENTSQYRNFWRHFKDSEEIAKASSIDEIVQVIPCKRTGTCGVCEKRLVADEDRVSYGFCFGEEYKHKATGLEVAHPCYAHPYCCFCASAIQSFMKHEPERDILKGNYPSFPCLGNAYNQVDKGRERKDFMYSHVAPCRSQDKLNDSLAEIIEKIMKPQSSPSGKKPVGRPKKN